MDPDIFIKLLEETPSTLQCRLQTTQLLYQPALLAPTAKISPIIGLLFCISRLEMGRSSVFRRMRMAGLFRMGESLFTISRRMMA
jgi:hypothetical protein